MKEISQSAILKSQYKLEQSEGLHKINRIATWLITLLLAYLTIFSDPISFPDMYKSMLPGRLMAISIGIIAGVLSWIPQLNKHGFIISFFIFLGGALQMAMLTAAMDNHTSDIVAWLFVNIVFCGVYPLPVLYSAVVVLIADAVYVILFLNTGFPVDLDFRMVLININFASWMTLIFKIGIERIRKREFYFRKGLQDANVEIATLNEQLKDENLRLAHELEIAQHIQSIVLPRKDDYQGFNDLDIACQMIPAAEVGGDFYDTIYFGEGGIISIGDVTDHGLHSGLIMMMVHTALRALSNVEHENIKKMYCVINKLLYDFRQKIQDHRIMSLIILRYFGTGQFVMTGQHESLLIMRNNGEVEDISSVEYGMFAGLDCDVKRYLDVLSFRLEKNDVLILYTDGVTEAVNESNEFFGSQGITDAVTPLNGATSEALKDAIVGSCLNHIGNQKFYDDLSVMVIRKK